MSKVFELQYRDGVSNIPLGSILKDGTVQIQVDPDKFIELVTSSPAANSDNVSLIRIAFEAGRRAQPLTDIELAISELEKAAANAELTAGSIWYGPEAELAERFAREVREQIEELKKKP